MPGFCCSVERFGTEGATGKQSCLTRQRGDSFTVFTLRPKECLGTYEGKKVFLLPGIKSEHLRARYLNRCIRRNSVRPPPPPAHGYVSRAVLIHVDKALGVMQVLVWRSALARKECSGEP